MSRLLTLASALLALASAHAGGDPVPRRPNIVFLISDDQRADTLHALGNPRIRTPNLDRIVRSGTAFTRAHIMGGMQGAVCVPSRAMMLIGRSLFRVREDLRDLETWPGLLGLAGWKTFITGKWHNGQASVAATFQHGEAIFLGGMTDQNRVPVRDLEAGGGLGPERVVEAPSSEIFADAAVRYLDSLRDSEPFCLYVAFTSPHDPRTPPGRWAGQCAIEDMKLPRNFLPEHPFDNGELNVRDELLLPRPRLPDAVLTEIAAYYAMIEHVDEQVGRILDALRRSGRESDTIVVFAGDNGLALGSHGLLGKQNLYEHSTRVPLVIAGPGIARNRRSDALAYLSDLAPTLCELTGVNPPSGADGRSLVPWLHGSSGQPRTVVFTAYRNVQRAVTDGRWKLIEYTAIGRSQLFDLRRDPDERLDLAGASRHASHQERLLRLLREQQRQLGDPLAPRP